MALTYPKKYEKEIDPETWDQKVKMTTAEEKHLNGFLLHRIAQYKDSEYTGTMLWYCIKEDFAEWKKETWAIPSKDIVREFRNFIRKNGVFVPMDGRSIGEAIQGDVIDAKEEHEWTLQEIEHHLRTLKKFNSEWNNKLNPYWDSSLIPQPTTSTYNPTLSFTSSGAVPQITLEPQP